MKMVQEKKYSFNEICKLIFNSINKRDIICFIISIIIIVMSNIQLIKIINGNEIRDYNYIINNVIICLAVIYINIYFFINKKEIVIARENLNEMNAINDNLSEVIDKVRCFKHDFNNIIQALDGYLYFENMKDLQKYFKSLLKECNYVNSLDFLNGKLNDNPAIYSILINKYKIAEENGIEMNIDVLANFNKLEEKSYEISRMLGILLDNALEATKECNEKIINVQFLKSNEDENKKIIIIENTYSEKDIDTTKIFDKNYSTKKSKGNSGLGLWKIKDIISKDSSFNLTTTKDDTMFKQKLEICI